MGNKLPKVAGKLRKVHSFTVFAFVLQEIMMDHSLRSISYIADIGDLLVIMARRRLIPSESAAAEENIVLGSAPKMICHVFESEEVRK